MKKYLVDTDVLIDNIREKPGVADYLDSLREWSYSVITAMELFTGAQSKKEIQKLEKFLADYREIPLSGDIGSNGRDIVREYAKADGMGALDALIAATAMNEGMTLSTKNEKHFRNIEGLSLEIAKYPAEKAK